MSISVSNDKPKIKKEKMLCNDCNKYKLCIIMDEKTVCKRCWKLKNLSKKNPVKYQCCVYCEICGHLGIEGNEKHVLNVIIP